jgi:hypothetical protein
MARVIDCPLGGSDTRHKGLCDKQACHLG